MAVFPNSSELRLANVSALSGGQLKYSVVGSIPGISVLSRRIGRIELGVRDVSIVSQHHVVISLFALFGSAVSRGTQLTPALRGDPRKEWLVEPTCPGSIAMRRTRAGILPPQR